MGGCLRAGERQDGHDEEDDSSAFGIMMQAQNTQRPAAAYLSTPSDNFPREKPSRHRYLGMYMYSYNC